MEDRDVFTVHAIMMDIQYAGRFFNSTRSTSGAVQSVVAMCMFPYFSLFIYESSDKLKRLSSVGEQLELFSPDAEAAVQRSRHTLKLFEDKKRGVQGQIDWFGKEIIAKQHARFIEGIRIPFLRRFGKDLGIYSYRGLPIANTHSAAFCLGVDADTLMASRHKGSKTIRAISEEYGQYLGAWGVQPAEDVESFITYMDPAELENDNDVRAIDYYSRSFNGSGTPEINGLLALFQSLMNTVETLLPLDSSPASRQTILKLRFLTVYQVVRSLADLAASGSVSDLSQSSTALIASIIDHPSTGLLTGQTGRPLRNALVHYGIDPKVDLTALSLNYTLYGLVELYLSMSVDDFEVQLGEYVSFVASEMNRWEKAGLR